MQTDEKKSKYRRARVVILLLALLVLVLLGVVLAQAAQSGRGGEMVYDPNAVVGPLPGANAQQTLEELQRAVDESMLTVSINATPCGARGGAVNWLIENPQNQGKLIRVRVERRDTGETVYATGAIAPGMYIETAPLGTALEPGEYPCIAWFLAYDMDTEKEIGRAGAEITLTVQEG